MKKRGFFAAQGSPHENRWDADRFHFPKGVRGHTEDPKAIEGVKTRNRQKSGNLPVFDHHPLLLPLHSAYKCRLQPIATDIYTLKPRNKNDFIPIQTIRTSDAR
ncbi:hypothetical protein [Larkinella humicola]|uniref:Uncharacterized protein n=1 Tax=Larkinella humicola TaxID=2607654 RepID=A0A5N1JMM7_9BACT|nr:hypothetical protein [Larkinella humicola]KAA9355213.1 hypothetical protein F0P93_11590 [Larkinella humicola]